MFSWLSGNIERLRFVLPIPEAFYLPLSKQIHVYSCISEVTWQTWNINFFHDSEVALTSRICFPIRLVLYQHLNLHIAYPGIPPEPSNHTRRQFLHLPSYSCICLLRCNFLYCRQPEHFNTSNIPKFSAFRVVFWSVLSCPLSIN